MTGALDPSPAWATDRFMSRHPDFGGSWFGSTFAREEWTREAQTDAHARMGSALGKAGSWHARPGQAKERRRRGGGQPLGPLAPPRTATRAGNLNSGSTKGSRGRPLHTPANSSELRREGALEAALGFTARPGIGQPSPTFEKPIGATPNGGRSDRGRESPMKSLTSKELSLRLLEPKFHGHAAS